MPDAKEFGACRCDDTYDPPERRRALLLHCAESFSLSPRESQVLLAALRGCQNKQIAADIGCSAATVTTYWQRIYGKMGCRTRIEVFARVVDFLVEHASLRVSCPHRSVEKRREGG